MKSFFALASLAALAVADTYPALTIEVDGQPKEVYIQWYPWWSSATMDGSSGFGYDYNNRMFLGNSQNIDIGNYFHPQLVGGSMEYDMDVSRSECGCNSSVYLVAMPTPESTDDDFKYCDANAVGGHWCPEFDLFEGNKHAFRTTAHTC